MSKKTWTKWVALALAVLIGAGVGYFALRSLSGAVVGAGIGVVIGGIPLLPRGVWEFIMDLIRAAP